MVQTARQFSWYGINLLFFRIQPVDVSAIYSNTLADCFGRLCSTGIWHLSIKFQYKIVAIQYKKCEEMQEIWLEYWQESRGIHLEYWAFLQQFQHRGFNPAISFQRAIGGGRGGIYQVWRRILVFCEAKVVST